MTARKSLFAVMSSLVMIFAVGSFAYGQQDTTTQDKGDSQDNVRTPKEGRHGYGRFGGENGERGDRGGRGFGHRGGMRGGMMMGRDFAKLNLTDEQKGQMKTLHESFRTATEANRKEMFSLFQQKREDKLNADGEARLKELRSQMRTQGEGLRTGILNVLTPEQKTQLEAMKQEHQQRREEFRNKWKERRQQQKQDETPASTDNNKANSF